MCEEILLIFLETIPTHTLSFSRSQMILRTSRVSDQVNLVRRCVLGPSTRALDTLADELDQTWPVEFVVSPAETANIMES